MDSSDSSRLPWLTIRLKARFTQVEIYLVHSKLSLLNLVDDLLRDSDNANVANILRNCDLSEDFSPELKIYALRVRAANTFTARWLDGKARDLLVRLLSRALFERKLNYRVEIFFELKGGEAQKQGSKGRYVSRPESLCVKAGIEPLVAPDFTIDSYVVGESNKFAHEVSNVILQGGPSAPSLLTLFGGSGVGKTHLLYTIYLQLLAEGKAAKVLCCYVSEFLIGFRKALRRKRETEFMEICKSADFLLLDDLHQLQGDSGDESQQMILFELLKHYLQRTKPTIITCEIYPDGYKHLKARIKTRLKSGFIVEIKPPEYNLRYLILQKNAQIKGVKISEEALTFLATNLKNNPRELVGAISSLSVHKDVRKTESWVDLKFVQSALANQLRHIQKITTIDEILQEVSKYFDVDMADLMAANKTRSVSTPRKLAMYLAREHTDSSFPEIAKKFGRHHTTVMHAHETISEQLSKDRKLNKAADIIYAKLME